MARDKDPFKIPLRVRRKLQNKEWLKKQFSKGKSAQEILEFSNESMDYFYVNACQLFECKRYEDAAHAFLFLVTLNAYHYDYWLGLGAATQGCGDYEAAIDAYEMAAIFQIESPIPYFHLAKCLFAMHDRENSMQAIDLALEYSEGRAEFEEIHLQAKAAKALLLKEG